MNSLEQTLYFPKVDYICFHEKKYSFFWNAYYASILKNGCYLNYGTNDVTEIIEQAIVMAQNTTVK